MKHVLLNYKSLGTVLPLFLILILALPMFSSSAESGDAISNTLPSHWVNGWGYRDELNVSDQDYQNFWLDNAGKILTMSMMTNDSIDATHSFDFIQNHFFDTTSFLPELIINSSLPTVGRIGDKLTITNRIVELTATNGTKSQFDQLAIGTNHSGSFDLAYLGADRIWYDNGSIHSAFSSESSLVFRIQDGFSKRSLYNISGQEFYTYLNATIRQSDPFVNVSLQLQTLNGSAANSCVKYLFLQVFNATETYPFYSGGLYSANGSFVKQLPARNSSDAMNEGGIIQSYSPNTSVFSSADNGVLTGQDAVAVRYGNQSIYDLEHWINDAPFGHSWFGPGYFAPQSSTSGEFSQPIYAQVYPILHFDYHLANETAKYIASNPKNSALSPPVSFGFDALGLALYAKNDTHYLGETRQFWNFYYTRYSDDVVAYPRAIDVFSLAGFKIYGCNKTVEDFTRKFLTNSYGSSIEEFGLDAAAAYQLKNCTGSLTDTTLYESFVKAFTQNNLNFADLSTTSLNESTKPSYTFQYGEAAFGLLLADVPYNTPIILSLMNAIYQSNVSGTVLNRPYQDDLANTETLPAYMLSTWLFENEMARSTDYSIIGLDNANITSIDYSQGTLLIEATGNNGTITVSHASMIKIYPVNSFVTIRVSDSNFTSTIITTNTITYETSSCSTLPFEFAITIMIVGTVATILVLRFREKNQRKTC